MPIIIKNECPCIGCVAKICGVIGRMTMAEKEILVSADLNDFPGIGTYKQNPELAEAFQKALEESPHVLVRWISVQERLPERLIYVLCAGRDGIGILRYTGATWIDENAITYTTNEITHWMPLPEMPEKE